MLFSPPTNLLKIFFSIFEFDPPPLPVKNNFSAMLIIAQLLSSRAIKLTPVSFFYD